MSAQVFISHSSKDESAAATIRQALENRGLACWIAGRDVDPGENFMSAIVRAIRAAKVMVLVFTENANTSQEIAKELALASQYELVVMPVRVEDVVPNDALAYALATSQWTDLFRDWELAIERLSTRIAALVAVESASGGGFKAAAPSRATTTPTQAAGSTRVTLAVPEEARERAARTAQAELPRDGAVSHGGWSSPRRAQGSPTSTTLRVVGGALIAQGVIRVFTTASAFAQLPSGYNVGSNPSSFVQAVVLPLALAAAAAAAGAMIYRGLRSARAFGLAICSICLLFQLYSFASGLSLIGRGITSSTFLLTFWIINPAYTILFAASLFYLLRWRPAPDKPAKADVAAP
jgi:hypothetical protein